MTRARTILPLAFVALIAAESAALASGELLVRAKDLYRSAAYEEALTALEQVTSDTRSPDYVEANEYRVYCLIALGRTDDARHAVETLVERDPFYQMRDQASPRVLALFTDVRQALLPVLVQRAYTDAKAAFDRKDPGSAKQFERVIELLNDPDVAARPALADLRIVTTGFLDLSRNFTPPPPAPTPSPAPAAPATAPSPAAPARVVYREGDAGLVPPVALSQNIPPFTLSRELKAPPEGALELLIDETGSVVSAAMSVSVHPRYDQQLIKIASSWKYLPAQKDGKPVPVRKVVRIRIVPN
jgi:hypothetical protein